MPTSLSREAHVDAVRRQGMALAEHAVAAGLDVRVPSCPDWTVAALVAHQAMVHRWAAGHASAEPWPFRDASDIEKSEADLVDYYRAGVGIVVNALTAALPDLEAPVFLLDAPAPPEFWARRQAHETTIHAVDALAACLGRLPTAAEVGLDGEFAIDGLDELLSGFLPRRQSALFQGKEYVVNCCPSDDNRAWAISVGEQLSTDIGAASDAAVTLHGTAAQLYLGLWNRGDEIEVEGDTTFMDRWREAERIRWG